MNLYSKRRERLMKDLGNNTMAIFFSSDNVYDPENGFKVNRNFYYLTGLEKPQMVLLLDNRRNMQREYLFILPFDEVEARWIGGRMSKQKASEISEVQIVKDLAELDNTVNNLLDYSRAEKDFKVYLDLWHVDNYVSLAMNYAERLNKEFPAILIKDVFPLITNMRLIKDEYELTCIKQAISITNQGIQSMMKTIKPGINEMAMEGVFNFVLAQNVCNENAFKTIAASGERATILHYSENNNIAKDGELFLTDLGATFKHYCADITRTFPVNGKFSEREKEIYQIVLDVQKLVEANARVGVKLRDLNKLVIDYYKQELPKHGLTKDVSEYYFHSISHHLGLDVHDVDGGLGAILEAGMVITNEPGLYIADEGIGVRIEDDLLITATGAECLSKDIIKEVSDIEEFMKK